MKNTIKQYLIIVIGLILLTSCEKKVDWDKESNMFKISNGKLYYKGELYSGIINHFNNGRKRTLYKYYSTTSWKDGLRDGYWEQIREDIIKEKGNYKMGSEDGLWETNYYNGKLHLKGIYINGKREDIWEWYYENGQLKKKGNFKNGIEEGIWEFYDENGKLQGKGPYQETGRKFGYS